MTENIETTAQPTTPTPNMGYIVTGRAAHGRVGRLFQKLLDNEKQQQMEERKEQQCCWIDESPYAASKSNKVNNNNHQPTITTPSSSPSPSPPTIAFLWENAPRSETKSIRNNVACYSHLPNGILLDDKWALARLFGGGHHHHQKEQQRGMNGSKSKSDNDNGKADNNAIMNNPHLATLESHCFRGAEFVTFAKRMGLLVEQQRRPAPGISTSPPTSAAAAAAALPLSSSLSTNDDDNYCSFDNGTEYQWEDLLLLSKRTTAAQDFTSPPPPPSPNNLWVIKDAMSNGAGGIWIVDESNVGDFIDTTTTTTINDNNSSTINSSSTNNSSCSSILHPTHRYIAQQYAWPPTLYDGRKCHVRVYALVTCDGRAFVHRRAFLHVANERFHAGVGLGDGENDGDGDDVGVGDGESSGGVDKKKKKKFEPSVHITNCCANSHDVDKFAGEICADLELLPNDVGRDGNTDGGNNNNARCDNGEGNILVPLGEYLPSISASIAALAHRFEPFIRGGEANGGFEYLGLDFVLSSSEESEADGGRGGGGHERRGVVGRSSNHKPVAYLLEVNAPPSQDTATGLDHAEGLHDEVISDLLRMWVLPNVIGTRKSSSSNRGGWRCVYTPPQPPSPPSSSRRSSNTATTTTEKDEAKAGPNNGNNSSNNITNQHLIVPSKAAILNKIRWAMFENRAIKEYERMWKSDDHGNHTDANKMSCKVKEAAAAGTTSSGAVLSEEEDPILVVSSSNKDNDNAKEALSISNNNDSGLDTKEDQQKQDNGKYCESEGASLFDPDVFVAFARSQFRYFSDNELPSSSSSSFDVIIPGEQQQLAISTTCNNKIFFESGGGAQVPQIVSDAVVASMSTRDRSVVGATCQREARLALASLLIGDDADSGGGSDSSQQGDHEPSANNHVVIMGANATSLLDQLACKICNAGLIAAGDEIVIATENHLANVTPWLEVARRVGATVRWWTVADTNGQHGDDGLHNNDDHQVTQSCILSDLINTNTKIVAISHVSNVLGMERPISSICNLVHRVTRNRGQVIVDGVAAAPHLLSHGLYSGLSNNTMAGGEDMGEGEGEGMAGGRGPDWYVASLHKMFGPHLGCLVGRRSMVQQLYNYNNNTRKTAATTTTTKHHSIQTNDDDIVSDETLCKSWELGTMNYEACNGVIALKQYFEIVVNFAHETLGVGVRLQQHRVNGYDVTNSMHGR
ncbi:hypothetical protein ACHAXR_007892 [Thalassiosira sp. AJA248-18]